MTAEKNYRSMLADSGIDATDNRLRILEIIDNSTSPLTAQEVFETLSRTGDVNRVTVYRILEKLVETRLLERIAAGDRVYRYGLGGSRTHPHFFCTRCGNMECLNPEVLPLDTTRLESIFTGQIEKVDVRVDGVCKNCLRGKGGA